ncbi:MAG: Cystathionine beta-synthase, partial [Bacteriovoracaceae bacterium]|nr:Cystathionine beta-synthase [Bacteriovoracaceae bacterium]
VSDVFHRTKMVSCKSSELAKDCIARFKEHGISQMPVVNADDSLYGIIAEYDLLNAVIGGSANLNKPIDPFVVRKVDTVDLETPIQKVQELLKMDKVPVVVDQKKVLGVITKIDLLEFFVNRGVNG